MDIIENRYRMIIEPERSGKTISDVCIAFGISRETWYKWKRRYHAYGIDGLKDQSRKPHNIKNVKVTEELEKLVLELRLNNRFGPMRIRFRLKRKYGVSLGTKTIYNLLTIHKLNVLSVKLKRKYKRFEMKRPNELVQMDTKGPFYLKASRIKHYFIHAIDDCSRKVVSKWCNRRTTEEALSVLKEWVKLHSDIRDVISIGKLVRKNDGPEEVEQIISTMIKYGDKRALIEIMLSPEGINGLFLQICASPPSTNNSMPVI